jgi:class 3 adenylate cyclase
MEPRIQYAKTKDGVRIAFATAGIGVPCVLTNDLPFRHVQLEWRIPYVQETFDPLFAKRTLIRFDPRGLGLSDRDVGHFTIDSWLQDLDAVVDRLGLEKFVLCSMGFSGLVAIAYAVRHPERVAKLILIDSMARVADAFAVPQSRALAEMLATDWEMFSENVAALAFGWGREDARSYGEFVRACVTPETARHVYGALAPIDLTELLARITAPTLVVQHSGLKYVTMDMAKDLVAGIPDARLVVVEGTHGQDAERLLRSVDEFLSEDEEAAAGAEAPEAGAFRTVLFTDVEGSTALTQRLGDAKARNVLRQHERMVREALKSHGGSEVKTMGDGFMASFSSATKALECAIAMQRAFAEHNESAEEPILVRIGLNAGEPIAEDDPEGRSDLFGTAVNRAARITAEAKGGEILVANVVRELAEGKDFLFADRGEASLKGFDEPVRLYEVRWRKEG